MSLKLLEKYPGKIHSSFLLHVRVYGLSTSHETQFKLLLWMRMSCLSSCLSRLFLLCPRSFLYDFIISQREEASGFG